MAQFPSSTNIVWSSDAPAQDLTSVVYAQHINEVRDEIRAIATELGSNPRGAAGTVAARMANLETSKASANHVHSGYILGSVLTTKGDLLGRSTSGPARVAAPGSNGQVLLSDTAQDAGMRWAVPPFEASGAVAAHEGKTDPHPQYQTKAENDALYSSSGHTHPYQPAGDYVMGGQGINAIVRLTQTAYNALATKDPSTLYVIVG